MFDNLEILGSEMFSGVQMGCCVPVTPLLLPDAEPVSSDFFTDFSSVLLDSFCYVNCCNTKTTLPICGGEKKSHCTKVHALTEYTPVCCYYIFCAV